MAQNNFDACLQVTLQEEGGYVNNPRDPGGPTNAGITIATLTHEMGRKATIEDVRNLTRTPEGKAHVRSIYHDKFWNLIDGDALPRGVDMMLFDICVNSGPGRALPWGRETLPLHPIDRIRALDRMRRTFWHHLMNFVTFGRGWFARENVVVAAALRMAGA